MYQQMVMIAMIVKVFQHHVPQSMAQ